MTTTEIPSMFRLSYGGVGYGWFVVEQYASYTTDGNRCYAERVVSGPYTTHVQAEVEKMSREALA